MTLCDHKDCIISHSPGLQYLPEFSQIHVHWVDDAIQPSHPLLPPSPFAFNLSQHQFRFQWVSSLHEVAKVLELQHRSFQWIVRVDFLSDWLVGSPCIPSDSQESAPTPQFKSIKSSVLSLLHSPTLTSIHDHRTKGIFHAKMGTVKDRNCMDLIEQKILRRGGKNIQNYTKKIFMTQQPRWYDHSPRARRPGMGSQVGL